MAGLGRVQSARMATTSGAVRRWRTAAGASAKPALTLQVRHQSAVTSTKTVWPCATSDAIRLSLNGRQNPSGTSDDNGGATRLGAASAAAISATTAVRRAAVGRIQPTATTAATSSAAQTIATATSLSTARIHSSQIAVAANATPRTRFNSIIHVPGFGSHSAKAGTTATARYGSANPIPMAAKIASATSGGDNSAKPSAVPSSGAVQGVANNVASTPAKKLPRCMRPSPSAVTAVGSGISNRPQTFAANTVRIAAIATKNTGCWNCNPQPTATPAARKPIATAAKARNVTTMPAALARKPTRTAPRPRAAWSTVPSSMSASTG